MNAKSKFLKIYIVLTLLLLTTNKTIVAQCDNQVHDEKLKITAWNIYMLPHFWIHTGQLKRAHEIVDVLKDSDSDVIVFEEAFDKTSRAIIREGLKKTFPYESGDPRKNHFYKSSCGLWIFSKVPFTVVKQIFFNVARGSDKLACKGAMLIQAEKNNYCFQLIATHLQSDLDGKDVQPIRQKQYEQIQKELLEVYAQHNVPQFVVGDFNTIHDDTSSYNSMIGTMKVKQCSLEGDRCYSYDYSSNDFILGTTMTPQLIDYILYKKDGVLELDGRMYINVFRRKWDAKHSDLSDHFAITGEINLR
jgi:endonuclease/exonuclease/phosphatase family metal-dependent hydrolase